MKRAFITLTVLIISSSLFAQKTEKDGDFQYKQENYVVASEIYDYLLKKDTSDIGIHYKMGICLLNCNKDPQKALYHLEKAQSTHSNKPDFIKNLGMAYFYNYKFDEASKYLKKHKETLKNEFEIEMVDLQLKMIENAKKYMASPDDVTFHNLGKYINSPMDEYLPFTSFDGNILAYTSNNKYDRNYFYYYNNVFLSINSNGIFKKGRAISSVNTYEDELTAGLSIDGQRLYIQLQGYEGFEDLFYSELNGKDFRGKFALSPSVNSTSAEYGATESINGDTLFFSSYRPDGFGGMDIYYSLRLPTGEWSEPTNIGSPINTKYDEDYPNLSSDGKTLYFCSNNQKSMGGFDIFKSEINDEDRTFSTPQNLGYPINSVLNDKTIAFSPDKRYAYIAAIRPEGFGSYDLYSVVFKEKEASNIIYILMLKTGTKDTPTPFANQDSSITIRTYKDKILIGEYAYNKTNSKATIALTPGTYILQIEGDKIDYYEEKIVVPDIPLSENIEFKNIFLNLSPNK